MTALIGPTRIPQSAEYWKISAEHWRKKYRESAIKLQEALRELEKSQRDYQSEFEANDKLRTERAQLQQRNADLENAISNCECSQLQQQLAEARKCLGKLASDMESFASDGMRPDEWLLKEWAKNALEASRDLV